MDILKTLLGILVLSCMFIVLVTVLAGAVIMGVGMFVSGKNKDQEKEEPDEEVSVQRS